MNSNFTFGKVKDFKWLLYPILVLIGGLICFNVKDFLSDYSSNTFISAILRNYPATLLQIAGWGAVYIFRNPAPSLDSPLFGPAFHINVTAFTIQVIVIIAILLIIVNNPFKTKIIFGLCCLFSSIFLGILRFSIMLTWDVREYPFLYSTMASAFRFFIYFFVFLIALHFVKKNKMLYGLVKEKLFLIDDDKTLLIKIIGIFVIYFFLNLIIFHPKLNIDDYFASLIMNSSRFVLSLINYQGDFIYPRILKFDKGGIFMGNPCLGVNLMLIYITAIILIGRKNDSTFTFLILGILGIITLNILRITMLFIYLYENTSTKNMFEGTHDLYNLVVYAFIFLMLYLWIDKQKKRQSTETIPLK